MTGMSLALIGYGATETARQAMLEWSQNRTIGYSV